MKNEKLHESRVPTFLCTLALLVAALSVGCTSTGEYGYMEEGATTATSEKEISGSHSPNDLSALTAQQYIDDVRIGRDLDPEGKVPDERVTRSFDKQDEIYVSMEVTDAPAGSRIRVSVFDATTDREVWTAEKSVVAGASYLGFNIDSGQLEQGAYRAEVIVGDENVARRDFQVSSAQA